MNAIKGEYMNYKKTKKRERINMNLCIKIKTKGL
jgi:hypothetical protein